MTDRTPTTEAGRRLLFDLVPRVHHSAVDAIEAGILAIEDDARAPLVAALEYADKMAWDLWGDWELKQGPQSSETEWEAIRRAALSRENQP